MRKQSFLLFVIALLQFPACAQQSSSWNNAPELNDGWKSTNPASVGINEDSLATMFDLIRQKTNPDFRAVLVIKDGKLAVEQYFNSFWRTNIHDIRSAGKSITSMIAGIAIDKGYFKTTDKVFSFFPEYKNIQNMDDKKSAITVADLLVMSSGLDSDDYDSNSMGIEENMIVEEDFLKFVLDLPMGFESGKRYAYSSAVAFLLGAIIENTTGKTVEAFGREYLFHPLGIKDFFWQKSPKGRSTGMGNIYMQARDLAKLGQLMLNHGQWNSQQIISENWIKDSFKKKFDIASTDPFAHGYGYMWYIAEAKINDQPIEYYFASGNGGNKIFIIPAHNMVIITMSSAYGQGYGQFRSHNVLNFILNSISTE